MFKIGLLDQRADAIKELITKHMKCYLCGKTFHLEDMELTHIPDDGSHYMCEQCYKQDNNLKKCECGNGYVKNEKKVGR